MGALPHTRIGFADANWLVATFHVTKETPSVEQWASAGPSTLIVSGPVLAEAQCNFWRLGNRWPALAADVKLGKYVLCGQTFESLASLATDLFQKYAPRCNVGTLDLLHLAAARHFGCRWFLSFDSRSGCRALAHALGMKVYPPLHEADRQWLAKLKP
jgi:hypothetical protein